MSLSHFSWKVTGLINGRHIQMMGAWTNKREIKKLFGQHVTHFPSHFYFYKPFANILVHNPSITRACKGQSDLVFLSSINTDESFWRASQMRGEALKSRESHVNIIWDIPPKCQWGESLYVCQLRKSNISQLREIKCQ